MTDIIPVTQPALVALVGSFGSSGSCVKASESTASHRALRVRIVHTILLQLLFLLGANVVVLCTFNLSEHYYDAITDVLIEEFKPPIRCWF